MDLTSESESTMG